MSEIEKAREAIDRGADSLLRWAGVKIAGGVTRYSLTAAIEALVDEKLAEHANRIRAIAREEIEAHEAETMHEAMHGEIASSPAVEAPAAGDPAEMAARLRTIVQEATLLIETLAASEANLVEQSGKAFVRAERAEDYADSTTALARRLAEELSKIAWHVVVPRTATEALIEARNAGLIE